MDGVGSRALIGSREWCALPDLGIPAVKARVDSGAKTSALHAFDLEVFERNGASWVRFNVHPLQKNQRVQVWAEARVVDRRLVRSSSGEAEQRYVIQSPLQLGDQQWMIELTLANRDSMGYRMLLGREAMQGRLLIDPDASYLAGKLPADRLNELYPARRKTRASGRKRLSY